MNPLKLFFIVCCAGLMVLLAAYFGAQIQSVLTERDYYKAKAEQLQLENALYKHNPKF